VGPDERAGPRRLQGVDEQVRFQLKFLEYAPILHISAKSGERTPKLLEAIDQVAMARRVRVPTPELNRFIEQITSQHAPVSPGKRNVRVLYAGVLYAAQTGVAPPSFVLFTNVATKLHFSYERYLENRLREKYGFVGSPIRITVRKRSRSSSSGPKH
jgi:GTPase